MNKHKVEYWSWFAGEYRRELDAKREAIARAEAKEVVVDKPWREDKPGLGQWKGGWLIKDAKNGVRVTTPVCCGKRYELCCGLHQYGRLYAKQIEGMKWEYDEQRGEQSKWFLMTWTIRARQSYENKLGGRTPTSWKQHMRRWHIESVPNLPGGWEELSAGKKYKWWLSGQYNEYEQVMLWPQMTPQENLSLWTAFFQAFEKAWERKWGERMTYLKAWEFTQQGVLHFHAPVRLPTGQTREEVEAWAIGAWCEARGGRWESAAVTYGKPKLDEQGWKYYDLLSDALDYALKYTMKNTNVEHSKTLKQDREFFGLEAVQDWNTKLRRYSKSNDWITADIGDIDTLTTHWEGLEILFDRPGYKKAYGRMTRALHDEGYKNWTSLTEKEQDDIVNYFSFWKVLSDNRERTPYMEWHGEDWREEGMSWTEPPDGTFRLQFLILGKLRGRR